MSDYILPELDPNLEIDWLAHVRELPKKYRGYNLLLLPPPPPGVIRMKPLTKAGKAYYNYITKLIASRMSNTPNPILHPTPNEIYPHLSHLVFHAKSTACVITADDFHPPQAIIHDNQPVWKLADGTLIAHTPAPVGFGDCSAFTYVGHIMPSRAPQTLPGLELETEFGPEDRALYAFVDYQYGGSKPGFIRIKFGYSDDMYQRQQTLQSGAIGHIHFVFKINPGKFTAASLERAIKKALAHYKVPGPKAGERYDLPIFLFSDFVTCSGAIAHVLKLLSVISTPEGREHYSVLTGRYITGRIVNESQTRHIDVISPALEQQAVA